MSKPAKKSARERLVDGERVVCAFAHPCSGPGWSNSPVVAVVRNIAGEYREVYIQPEAQPSEMVTLYAISAQCTAVMNRCATAILGPRAAKRGGR